MTDKIIPAVILIVSVAAVGYFLLQAPLCCGSATRDGILRRNNSSGLLIGCHLRQHKWQKLQDDSRPQHVARTQQGPVGIPAGRASRNWYTLAGRVKPINFGNAEFLGDDLLARMGSLD